MSKVQIIEYIRDEKFSSNYIEKPDQNPGLFFNWFKIGETRDIKLIKQGARDCIEYYNGTKWKLITGLLPLNENLFYGDIESETVAIWIHPDKDFIKMALFKGHCPKFRNAREKKVINFIRAQKNKR